MNKSALFTRVAARASVSKATADALVTAVFSTVGDALARDETIAIASATRSSGSRAQCSR